MLCTRDFSWKALVTYLRSRPTGDETSAHANLPICHRREAAANLPKYNGGFEFSTSQRSVRQRKRSCWRRAASAAVK